MMADRVRVGIVYNVFECECVCCYRASIQQSAFVYVIRVQSTTTLANQVILVHTSWDERRQAGRQPGMHSQQQLFTGYSVEYQ